MYDWPLRDIERPVDPAVLVRLQRGLYDRPEHPTTWLVDHHPDELENLGTAVAERLRVLAEKRRQDNH